VPQAGIEMMFVLSPVLAFPTRGMDASIARVCKQTASVFNVLIVDRLVYCRCMTWGISSA
jgi:hypothetical protein